MPSCPICSTDFAAPLRGHPQMFCSQACRQENYRRRQGAYAAMNIQVVEPERFDWSRACELAEKYNRDAKWIQRALNACREAGTSAEYFIKRYLEAPLCEPDKAIPMDPYVDEAMREILWPSRKQASA